MRPNERLVIDARREANVFPGLLGGHDYTGDLLVRLANALEASDFLVDEARREREGIRRFLSGVQVQCSSDIADQPTYGYGKLDEHGCWEYPVPAGLVQLRHEVRQAAKGGA